MEQRPPTSPKVLLYPTRKLKGFRVAGEAKKCVHQYRPPEVGIAEPKSACQMSAANAVIEQRPVGVYHGQSNDENKTRGKEPALCPHQPQEPSTDDRHRKAADPNHAHWAGRYGIC